MLRSLTVLLAFMLAANQPATAVGLFDEAIANYRAGRFQQAVVAFEAYLAKDPRNQTARYYLANSLVKTRNHGEAGHQYRLAYLLDPASRVADYCRQAMRGYRIPIPTNETIVDGGEPSAGENSPRDLAAAAAAIRRQAGQQKEKYQSASLDSQKRLRYSVDEELKAIDQQMEEELARLHDPIMYVFGVPRPNWLHAHPDMLKEKEDEIRRVARERKEAVLHKLEQDQGNYHVARQARDSVLDEVTANLESQLTAPAGRNSMRLQARGTGLYVRNYGPSSDRPAPDVHPAVVRIVDQAHKGDSSDGYALVR